MAAITTVLALFSISLGVCLSTKIIEVPKNAFALLHADAAFNCTVSLPWRIIIWLMDTIPILTIVPDGPIITDSRFHQRNYTTKRTFTSELIISPVTMRENMTVRCSLQTEEYQQAFLFVQVDGPLFFVKEISSVVENRATDIVCKAEGWNPVPTIRWKKNRTVVDSKMYTTTIEQSSDNLYNTISTLNLTLSANAEIMCLADIEALPQPKTAALFITVKSPSEDQTWLIIAIVVPIAAAILLIILIIVIIICIKRRKHHETSYRNELKRMSTKKPFKITTDGVENLGMSTGSVNDLQRSPSLTSPYWINTWSGEKNNDTVEAPTIPAVDYGIQKETPNQPMDFSSSPRKTRHVTAV
ncbi:immunoglobulin superfamily member 5 isoform X2 [Pristis pectinata]|uniref:immunoglobulin superfamily member 5 isoform X2 n=1 Tax=Pristis pectinata TaxID=685728 RepID=UPI00223DF2DE|nr:immunoglobulin superfamily member 5 isoform X2 [Pristis pectinata]XP_051869241.1 immunoglobulin superfamily member 5 isoform X2 [Pristis pectinata]